MRPQVRHREPGFLLGSLTCVWLGVLPVLVGSAEKGPAAQEVRPILLKDCSACHGDNKPKAGLNRARFEDRDGTPVTPLAWKHVWERVKSRQMPPSDRPQPTAQEREQVLAWIESVFADRTLAGHSDPGPLRGSSLPE